MPSPSKEFRLPVKPSLQDLEAIRSGTAAAFFQDSARRRVQERRRTLMKLLRAETPIYGVNTGFGSLASKKISEEDLEQLQRNLVLSHACGVGEPLSEEEARTILFLRANELSRGYSGVRTELIEGMLKIFNAKAAPMIPSQGSVGASGDLAPQAHMALLLIGQGKAFFRGRLAPARAVLKKCGLKPLKLEAKEGLSLVNGTQAMQAVGGLALLGARRVFNAAQKAAAASLEALSGTPEVFRDELQRLKPHPGQIKAAEELRRLLEKSEIRESHRANDPRVQDPYSLRCLPQVHGAILDTLEFSRRTLETEMSSVTDNPAVFSQGNVLSSGNFHGQALSFAFDFAAIALTALGNMSERRIFQLTMGQAPRLKPFLAERPGLESGHMIVQVASAALASENKVLSHPSSSDSIPTSANQEDFVSMGMGAALKLKRIVQNAAQIVAAEILCAARALEFHAPLRPGRGVTELVAKLNEKLPAAPQDQPLSALLEKTRILVLSGHFD